jgi:aryl-alcohol dehydrogenase-like predicted oxidoreductase
MVIEPEVLPLCRDRGIGQLAFQPLAQGVLTGKYVPGEAPPEGSRATAGGRAPTFVSRVLGRELLEGVQQLRPLAAESGLSMAQFAIAWVLHQEGVSSTIAGASRPSQITENAAAAGAHLSPEILRSVDEVLSTLIDRDPSKTARMMAVEPNWRD